MLVEPNHIHRSPTSPSTCICADRHLPKRNVGHDPSLALSVYWPDLYSSDLSEEVSNMAKHALSRVMANSASSTASLTGRVA